LLVVLEANLLIFTAEYLPERELAIRINSTSSPIFTLDDSLSLPFSYVRSGLNPTSS